MNLPKVNPLVLFGIGLATTIIASRRAAAPPRVVATRPKNFDPVAASAREIKNAQAAEKQGEALAAQAQRAKDLFDSVVGNVGNDGK